MFSEIPAVVALLSLIWLHFVADFILQSDYTAKNKSKSNRVLLKHVLIYGTPFLVVGLTYALINAALHFCIDWGTSRWTSHLYVKGHRHWFFVVIGLDQALHATCLMVTYYVLFK